MSTTVDLGKISLTPMNEYVHGTRYEKLDLVTYQRGLFIAKENNQNILPTVTATWMKIGDFSEGAIMTDSDNGVGHPDGQTITVDANGTFSATCKVVYVTEVPTVSNATRNTLYIQGSSADGFSIYTLIGNTMENVSKMIPKYAGSSSAGGSATSAVKLQNARTIQTNLASTSSASFDGTANVTPGVTGVLPVANGGTGQTTLANSEKALLTSLNTSNDALIESGDYIPVLTQSGGGGVSWYTATKRSPSTFWDYIVNKISVNLGLTSTTYGGKSANASNAEKATKLSTARTIRTNLGSTSTASFDGTANVTPGVTGTLPVANGGTGQTTLNAGMNSFINSLDVGTAVPKGEAYFISQDANGGTLNTYFRRPISKIWDYIKNQIGTKGSATQPVYMNAGVPTACTYTLNKSVPSNAVFTDTNTWRPVQNNLTSTSTSDCLSANQGKLLNDRVATLESTSTKKLTNNSYIRKKGNVVSFYSHGGASTSNALSSITLESVYRPPYPIHIAGYLCRVGAVSRYPAFLSIGSDGVIGVYYMQQVGGDAFPHNGTDWWFDGNGTWVV